MPRDETPPAAAQTPGPAGRGGRDPLQRLRESVERAATELERLRTENAQLAERIRQMGNQEGFDEGPPAPPPALALEGDPEALRARIEAFIEAIDRVLAERAAIDAAEEPSDQAP